MNDNEKDFVHPGETTKILHRLAIATGLLFILSVVIGVSGYVANGHRIDDIQQSRVYSCQQTYEAFKKVFRPLIPPPELQTPKQKQDTAKFFHEANVLKRRCVKQTNPKQATTRG